MFRCFRRAVMRRRRRSPIGLLPMLLAVALAVGACAAMTKKFSGTVETLAVSKTVNLISMAVGEVTDECLAETELGYSGFVDIERNNQGQVTMLSMKVVECSTFKRLVTERLALKLENIEPAELAVPLGELTGMLSFASMGPSVRVRIRSVGDVTAEYSNEFTSAGVNQTKHSIYLDLSITVYLLLPGGVIPVLTRERVCIGETVIVGEVPNTYLNLQDGVG